jgi:hypothetical protein
VFIILFFTPASARPLRPQCVITAVPIKIEQ